MQSVISKHIKDLPEVDISLLNVNLDGEIKMEMVEQIALLCKDKSYIDPQWGLLAGRLMMEIIFSEVPKTFSEAMIKMKPILHAGYYEFVLQNGDALDRMIISQNDFTFDMFAVCTLRKSYLAHLKLNDKSLLMETPQYMYLRVATYLHQPDLGTIKKVYDELSSGAYSHASPTLFNSGMRRPQLASCFLHSVSDDIQGISKAWHDQAIISMNHGGIGANYSDLRHSEIGQHGFSRGVVPWLKITNEILKTVDQCFAPDTVVYTKRGSRKISEIQPGDKMVLTNGTLGRVKSAIHYPFNSDSERVVMRTLKLEHYFDEVMVAECHPLLAVKVPKECSFPTLLATMGNGENIPSFISVKHLDESYLVALPIPKYQKDVPTFTEQDCRMYGMLLSQGHISNDNTYRVYARTCDRQSIDFIKTYLSSRNTPYEREREANTSSFKWVGDGKLIPFTRKMLNKEKGISPFLVNLPVHKSLQIFRGFVEVDGCIEPGIVSDTIDSEGCETPDHLKGFDEDAFQVIFGYKSLAEDIRYLLLRAGVAVKGHIKTDNITYKTKNDITYTKSVSYVLSVPKVDVICELFGLTKTDEFKDTRCLIFDSKIWSRVTSNTIAKNSNSWSLQTIVDLEMERVDEKANGENASYLTCIGQAHNGGRRKGSGTVYLRDLHVDVFEFVELRDEGPEDLRARDLFLGLMISDLFMNRVLNDQMWSLFCPNKAKGLFDKWGAEFEMAYLDAEKRGIFSRQVKARELWQHILTMQIKRGMPFILYMDACNRKSNQRHSGVIRLL